MTNCTALKLIFDTVLFLLNPSFLPFPFPHLISGSILYDSNGYSAALEHALGIPDICSNGLTEDESAISISLQQVQSFVSETEYSIAYYPIANEQLKILAQDFSVAEIAKEVEALSSFTTLAVKFKLKNELRFVSLLNFPNFHLVQGLSDQEKTTADN